MEPVAGEAGHFYYFQYVYKGLVRQPDAGRRRRFLDEELEPAAVDLAELKPLRIRERIPTRGHYTHEEEQLSRLMRMYALSRTSDYLLEVACPTGSSRRGSG